MSENKIPYKIYLSEEEMPRTWYNLRADMKNKPAPLLNPGTGRPMTAEELEGLTQREFRQKYGDRAFAWRGVVPLRRNLALLSQEKDSL